MRLTQITDIELDTIVTFFKTIDSDTFIGEHLSVFNSINFILRHHVIQKDFYYQILKYINDDGSTFFVWNGSQKKMSDVAALTADIKTWIETV